MARNPRPLCADCHSALKVEYEQPLFSVTEFDGRGVCVRVFGARAGEHGTDLHTSARRQRRAAAVAVRDGDDARADDSVATTHARATADGGHAAFDACVVATAERARVSAGGYRADADDLVARA